MTGYDLDVAEVGDVVEFESEELDWHFVGEVVSTGPDPFSTYSVEMKPLDIIDGSGADWFTYRYRENDVGSGKYEIELLEWE